MALPIALMIHDADMQRSISLPALSNVSSELGIAVNDTISWVPPGSPAIKIDLSSLVAAKELFIVANITN